MPGVRAGPRGRAGWERALDAGSGPWISAPQAPHDWAICPASPGLSFCPCEMGQCQWADALSVGLQGWAMSPERPPPSQPALSCSRQAPSTELSASSSCHSKSCDQLRCSPYLSSGDIADALSVHSAGSSSSDVEEINVSFVPESPDGQEKKVTAPCPIPPSPAQPLQS